ncbi:diguanylate cyclase [Marinimicrobium alkaliphilum]|uniref:diguanylate cyclase n=1 Tax=Marinimicrobium alkaliphilum TaxID=2202654 RepID=UPI000DBA475F|nr:diguanylate cyclase [Marinimicrobium alkaliphilum]
MSLALLLGVTLALLMLNRLPGASALESGAFTQQGQWLDGPPARTGGSGRHELQLRVNEEPQTLIVDFRNSGVVGRYQHRLYNGSGRLLEVYEGGHTLRGRSDYFLRHAHRLALTPGDYTLVTELESPYYLAPPTPILWPAAEFENRIVRSQTLTLVIMGIFLGLAFYYLVTGIWRRALNDLLYAGFITGNILFLGTSQLVFRDLFGWTWFHLSSVPILFSNACYIGFVMLLLSINRQRTPRLFYAGWAAIGLLASFWFTAWMYPNGSLELARAGVAIFGLYGLVAGINQALARNPVAYFYLIANVAFLLPALVSISVQSMRLNDMLLLEQLGMMAVAVEVLLLAQVMSYQIGRVYQAEARQRAAQDHSQLLTNLAAQVPGVLYQFRMTPDGHFDVPYASERVHEMFELSPEEVIRDAASAFGRVIPEDFPDYYASIEKSAHELSPWEQEFRVLLPKQGLRWRAGRAYPEQQDDGTIVWYGFINDITERKRIEEKIRHMAQHDPLTGLPNRTLFVDRLNQALERAKRNNTGVGLLFIDLNNFKAVNDQQGHQAGDRLLKKVASQMVQDLRGSDTAARLGGDEFVILLEPVRDRDDALRVAHKVLSNLRVTHHINKCDYPISASIGVSLYPEHGNDVDSLIREADTAMYEAKHSHTEDIRIAQPTQDR